MKSRANKWQNLEKFVIERKTEVQQSDDELPFK